MFFVAAKTLKWWCSGADISVICENDMLWSGNFGLKMGVLKMEHTQYAHISWKWARGTSILYALHYPAREHWTMRSYQTNEQLFWLRILRLIYHFSFQTGHHKWSSEIDENELIDGRTISQRFELSFGFLAIIHTLGSFALCFFLPSYMALFYIERAWVRLRRAPDATASRKT